jgi:hypothetical protein
MSPSSNTKLSTGEPYAATIAISAFLAAVIALLARPRWDSLQGLLLVLELYLYWFSLIFLCCLVLLILWAEFFHTFKVPLPPGRARDYRRSILRWRPVIVGGVTVIALGFGLVHSCSDSTAARTHLGHVEQSIKLLTFNADEPDDASGARWRDVALVWATAALFLLAFEAIVKLFSQPMRRLQLSSKRDHLVVCGLGQLGEAIARQWYEEQAKGTEAQALVVIESDPNNPNISLIEDEFGGIVHIGDGTDEETLRLVSAHNARTIFAVMHDDDANVECVRAIHKLDADQPAEEKENRKELRTLVLHLLEGSMVKLENQVRYNSDRNTQDVVQPFNVLDQSLSQLFAEDLLDNRPQEVQQVAHFIVIGFSPIAEEVILRIGEQAHYENLKRSRVTIVHAREESGRVNAFRARYPQFFPKRCRVPDAFDPPAILDDWEGELNFAVNGGFFEFAGRADADEIVDRIAKVAIASKGAPPVWVFICLDDHKRNTALAIELQQELLRALGSETDSKVVLLPYVPIRPLLTVRPDDFTGTVGPIVSIKLWGDARRAINIRLLRLNPYRKLAFACHAVWSSDPEDVFLRGPSWKIHSSLMSALHLHVKFAGLGLRLVVKTPDSKAGMASCDIDKIAPEKIELLAKVEKNRWNAERLIAGWKKDTDRADEEKKHPLLVPWDRLKPEQQKKEKDNLRKLLTKVAMDLDPEATRDRSADEAKSEPLSSVFTLDKRPDNVA